MKNVLVIGGGINKASAVTLLMTLVLAPFILGSGVLGGGARWRHSESPVR